MLNKFFKIIHNKYSKLFGFIFFLRYLFAIFITSTAVFLTIPSFFNFEKKAEIIKSHLKEKYNFKINNYDKIKFNQLPVPNLEIQNASIELDNFNNEINVKNLRIFPKFLNIYNYENFKTNKIILKDSDVILDFSDLNNFTKQFISQKNKINFKNLNIKIADKEKIILQISNLRFSNYGYEKNLISGEIFGKRFRTELANDLKNVNFKLLNTGVTININFDEKQKENLVSGILKSKILNSNFKFNFEYEGKKLNIKNTYFRNKNLSFKNESLIIFEPYLDANLKFRIEEFNTLFFKNLDLNKLIQSRNFIKKINSKNEINFLSKKFSRNLIDILNLKFDLAYGSVNFKKKLSISNGDFDCEGNMNLLEEYPKLFFDCRIEAKNKYKFLKRFSINTKNRNDKLNLEVKGNLSILKKKINFEKVLMNENYNASNEDLKYFKDTFETVLFDENFLKIFNYKKIKKFIFEVS